MKFNETDIVFGLSFIASMLAMFVIQANSLVDAHTLLWVGLIANLLQGGAYLFYEKINGIVTPPTYPTTTPPPAV